MKKKLFCFLAIPALVLTGCSFKDGFNFVKGKVFSWFGIGGNEETPANEGEPHEHEGEHQHEEQPPAHTHTFVYQSNAYEHWGVCECGEIETSSPHNFHLHKHTDMTCTDTSHDEYVCEECGYTKIVNGTEHLEHNYVSKVTKEATCQTPGEITFECTLCGDKFVNQFTKPDAHNLVLDSETGGVKLYKCSHEGCDFSKKVIDHSTQTEAAVTTEALKDAGEIQLQNAAIAFDEETLEDFGENVTISADTKDNNEVVAELALDDEAKEKLEGKPIIDFSVVKTSTEEEDEKVSEFAGSVKVTIPYTLKANEDPDCIAIWYLSEDGTESIQASYSNGFVSFETTHFSYYAVVHLTPEEVCEQFGHEMVKGNLVESSCYAHGHDDRVCRRCGKLERETLPLSQHKYEFKEKKDATATSEGYIRYECKVCHDVYDAVLPKVASDGRPFYVNLVYSLLSPDFRTYSSTLEEDGSTQFYESYQGLDYDGQPFEYSSSGFAEYKGYMYYSGNEYDRYQYSYTTVSSQFAYYKQFIDALPSIYKEKFNDLVSWFAEKYFVQTETPEGYEFGLNYAAIKETVDLFVNESIGDAIKGVIGQKTYDDILDFISKHYGDTVKEFLDELESRGFIIQELYDSIVTVLKSNGAQDDDIPALDSILTEDIKKMKLTEFAAFVLSQIMRSDVEQTSEMIPQTYADFKEMLDSGVNARDPNR